MESTLTKAPVDRGGGRGALAIRVGYWAAQEQFPPEELLERAVLAERVGFRTTASSDHFHPWFDRGGQSIFCWVWMASMLERTRAMEVGTAVTAVVHRYHPAIVAQAFATLGNLHPGRVFLGVGTGEAMNEVPLGMEWPGYEERAQRLEEAIQIIRLLWEGEFVTFEGKYFQVRKANLYTKPPKPIPLFMAASGPKSAAMVGRLTDGLITYITDGGQLKGELLPAMERGAREAGKDPKSLERIAEFSVSWDPDYDRAAEATRTWASTTIPSVLHRKIADPRELQRLGDEIPREEVIRRWFVTTDVEDLNGKIEECQRLGFTRIYIHSTSPDERAFIREFGRKVLPGFRGGQGEGRRSETHRGRLK